MIKVEQPADPWQRTTTVSGLAADDVISALQKSLRRALLENAVLLGWEMYRTSPEMEEMMWSRLCVIAVEDVGAGNPQLPVLIETLYQQHLRYPRPGADRFLFAVHAIRMISGSDKERSSDDLMNWARRAVELGEREPEIPDVALDMHTLKGQKIGRDYRYFLEEASKVVPEKADKDQTWKNWLLAALDAGKLE